MMSSPPRMRCWCYHRSRGLSARQRSFVAPVAPGGRGIRARRRSVLARMAGEKPCRHNSCRIAVLLGLVARQRHQPGLGFRRDRRLRPRSVIECRKCAIGQRPFDAALHRLMMHPEFFPDRAKTMVSPGQASSICARSTRLARSVREREMPVNRPISSPLIANSNRMPPSCHHTNPRSANSKRGFTDRLPVPLRPVSWNRSSRSSRRRGSAPKSKMLAHISKTELEVICMTVAVAVSHAMFSARFRSGCDEPADRFIGYGRFHKGNRI